MDHVIICQSYLKRLGRQLDNLMPPPTGSYGECVEPIPLERLPVLSSLVREYIECSAIVAEMERSNPNNRQEDEN